MEREGLEGGEPQAVTQSPSGIDENCPQGGSSPFPERDPPPLLWWLCGVPCPATDDAWPEGRWGMTPTY